MVRGTVSAQGSDTVKGGRGEKGLKGPISKGSTLNHFHTPSPLIYIRCSHINIFETDYRTLAIITRGFY